MIILTSQFENKHTCILYVSATIKGQTYVRQLEDIKNIRHPDIIQAASLIEICTLSLELQIN